jgi:hypothetical protein
MPEMLEYDHEHEHRQWKRSPIAEGAFSKVRAESLAGKLDALDQRVKELQYKQAQRAPALNANMRQVLRTADDDMKPLRKIVARIVSERPCSCGWKEAVGSDDPECWCKECGLR